MSRHETDTDEELIGGAEIKSDVFFAKEIEMPWESDKVEGIASMPNYATTPATGHRGLADQVLLERDGDGWKCVGHYVDDIIIVFPRAQNIGIADVLSSLYGTKQGAYHCCTAALD